MHHGALPTGWLSTTPNLAGVGLLYVTNVAAEQS
jgi:hypothetical protein